MGLWKQAGRAANAEKLATLEATLAAVGKSQAVIEFKPDGTIVTANANFLSALGYTLEEIVGQHHRIFCAPAFRDSADYRAFWENLGAGRFVADRFQRIAKSGRAIWIQASYNPVLGPDGRVMKIVKFATDVTDVENDRIQKSKDQQDVVTTLAESLKRLSGGDLTATIRAAFPSSYETLRQDYNAALDGLAGTMRTIGENSTGVNAGSAEIMQATDDLSRRTEQQAASLEETAAALDEVTTAVKRTADSATQADGVVVATRGEAERSGVVMNEAVSAMGAIESSAREISAIIGVIDEIAFQTNLLALNAGVEAARAGEAGRGFAVVASEVRALAQRSAEAAKEIKTLISTSTQQVARGVKLVAETGSALERILQSVAEVSSLVSEIAASAKEQSLALAEVNTAVNEMDQSTQQTAAMVEQSAAASRALSGEASSMSDLVGRFTVGGEGAAVRAQPREAPQARPTAKRPAKVRVVAGGGAAREAAWEEF